ncbi:hypothetical protein HDE77_001893 [Rhodanobacter sp. MP7CTX1]|nr:hypothetical protein [Rhodanobacter sp. MP7CTX1]
MAIRQNMEAFWSGAMEGLREAPRSFFAPLITLFRWMYRVSEEGMGAPNATFTISPIAKKSLQATSRYLGTSPAVVLELAIRQLHADAVPNLKGRYRPLSHLRDGAKNRED